MTKKPLSWTIWCACLFIIGISLIAIPAGALDFTPVTSPSSNTVTIANGDSVMIHGIATGHPRNGLQLWIISHNYLKVTTLAVNDDNTYLYELKPADTENLASGQYFFLVQHPMMNSQFDVVYNPPPGRSLTSSSTAGKARKFSQSPDREVSRGRIVHRHWSMPSAARTSMTPLPPTRFTSPRQPHSSIRSGTTMSGTSSPSPVPPTSLLVTIL